MSFRTIGLAAAARYLGGFMLREASHRWSFNDNEPIDDVSEKFFTYFVHPTTYVPYGYVGSEAFNATDPAYGTSLAIDYAPLANKPFSISCKFRLTNFDATYQSGVIARWSETDANQRSWAIWIWNDGKVIFSISDNGGLSGTLDIPSQPGLVTLNTDYHVCVERDKNNLISIYLNGARVASAVDGRGAFQKCAVGARVRRGVVGKVWDIRLEHKPVFNGIFVGNVPADFGDLAPFAGQYYTADEAADIVYQMSGRRSSTANEVDGAPLALVKSNMYNGKLFVSNLATATYLAAVDYFGAGDFTMECKFMSESAISGTGILLMSHWYNGSSVNDNNRWIVLVFPDGSLQVVFANSNVGGDYTIRTTAANVIKVNNSNIRQHIVIERYNGIIKVFVDGIERLSWEQAAPLWATSGNLIKNTYNGTGYGQHRIWDIRIAKRAMYRHNAPQWSEGLPKMPVDWRASRPTYQITVGSNDVASGTVTYRGFAKHFLYGASTVSFGELPHEYYYNTVTGKVMRIVALFYQTNGHVVLALKESTKPYTPEMPTMTNRIKINGGQTFDWASGTVLAAATDPSTIAKTFGLNNVGNVPTAFGTDETLATFSFV